MKQIKTLSALFFLLIFMLAATLLILLIFADNANFAVNWVDEAVTTILDMIKVVVGAAVGSISAAFVASVKSEEEKTEEK